jgi:ferredoxin
MEDATHLNLSVVVRISMWSTRKVVWSHDLVQFYRQKDGAVVDASAKNSPISNDTYYITPNKCTECQGFHEEPQCAAVCPVDCCVPDDLYKETIEELLQKKEKLHL